MTRVTSADGTSIAFDCGGRGPSLLLIHGTSADRTTTWRLVRAPLEERFTVCVMDRRGRGDSSDAADYALDHEAEDVLAVVHALEPPVYVLGHSFGALCAIEAARRTGRIDRLVLYEGVPLTGASQYPAGAIPQMQRQLDAGDPEGALITLLRDVAGMPDADIDQLRAQAGAWPRRVANAPTIVREVRADSAYVFDPSRFAGMTTPTLLLVGDASPPRELEHARGVSAALADSRVVILKGQAHTAMHSAPDLFVREVVEFLT